MNFKQKPFRSKKYLDAARGQDCTLNSEYCNYNPETTVFCHLNEIFAGKGTGIKASDIAGFDGCSGCHTAYDTGKAADPWLILRAVIRTQMRRIEQGVLKV